MTPRPVAAADVDELVKAWKGEYFGSPQDDGKLEARILALVATRERQAVQAERARCLRVVASEEELDGEIPLDIAVQCLTPSGATAVLRATVAATKQGITTRINAGAEARPAPAAEEETT